MAENGDDRGQPESIFPFEIYLYHSTFNIIRSLTDHSPQFLIVKQVGISYKNMSCFKHDFSKFNIENLLNGFVSLHQNYLDNSSLDINNKFNRFYPAWMN